MAPYEKAIIFEAIGALKAARRSVESAADDTGDVSLYINGPEFDAINESLWQVEGELSRIIEQLRKFQG